MKKQEIVETPEKLQDFMYALMKEAYRGGFNDWREYWGIDRLDYGKIKDWFKQFGVEL